MSSFAPVFARSRARFAPSAIVAARSAGSATRLVAADEDEPLERRLVLRVRSSSAPGRRCRAAGRRRPRAPAPSCGSESSRSQAIVPPTRSVAPATAAAAVRTVSASSSSAGPSPTRTIRLRRLLRVEDGRPRRPSPATSSSSAIARRAPSERRRLPECRSGPTGTARTSASGEPSCWRLRPASGPRCYPTGFLRWPPKGLHNFRPVFTFS